MDLFPVSGRQHQLRKHMKLVGHPIFGDEMKRIIEFQWMDIMPEILVCEGLQIAGYGLVDSYTGLMF